MDLVALKATDTSGILSSCKVLVFPVLQLSRYLENWILRYSGKKGTQAS